MLNDSDKKTQAGKYTIVQNILLSRNIWGSFYQYGLTLIPAWISNHKPNKAWDGITYSFPNFNGAIVEVWGWISNFILHYTMDVIT